MLCLWGPELHQTPFFSTFLILTKTDDNYSDIGRKKVGYYLYLTTESLVRICWRILSYNLLKNFVGGVPWRLQIRNLLLTMLKWITHLQSHVSHFLFLSWISMKVLVIWNVIREDTFFLKDGDSGAHLMNRFQQKLYF